MDNFFAAIIISTWQLCLKLIEVFSPLIIGLFLAYILNPSVEWIRLKLSGPCNVMFDESPKGRMFAIFITYILLLIFIALVIYCFLFLIIGTIPSGDFDEIIGNVYTYFVSSYDTVSNFISLHMPKELIGMEANPLSHVQSWLEKSFSFESMLNTVSALAGTLLNIFVGVVISIYLLKDKEFFLSLWHKFLSIILKQHVHGAANEVLHEINDILLTFIRGTIVDSIIVALLSSFALSIIQVKFAVIIGIIGGILNVIPYFGPFLATIPAFLVALTTGNLAQGLLSVVILIVIQQIDSNYIYPKIVGTSTGLHPVFVLLSVSIFGYLFGVLGMLIAVPLGSVIQVLVKRWAYRQ